MTDQTETTVVFAADLRAGTGGAACLRRGWADPEPPGTWTLGHESRLAIDWSPHWPDATLAIEATPHLHAGLAAARLEVSANGIPLGTFSLADRGEVVCPVAGWMIGPRQTLEIVLRQPDAARPSAVSASGDARELGFLIERIVLRCRSSATPIAAPDATVLRAFASLGDNCEFGLVQRRCGIEQLGLFRFAQIPIANLVAALDGSFDGLDDPEAIAVMQAPRLASAPRTAGPRDYFVYHIDYGAAWHAGVFDGPPTEHVLADERRRLAYLKRNLLEELAAGSRIYVVRRVKPLARDDVLALWRALQRHGPNALLWAVPADATHRAGTVVPIEPGLYQGYIDHLAADDDPSDVSVRGWIELCRRTLQLHAGA